MVALPAAPHISQSPVDQASPRQTQMAQPKRRNFAVAADTPLYADAPWEKYESICFRELAPLGAGSSCSAHLQETCLDGQTYTFISKYWPVRFMHQWNGFFSELALYKSQRYLRDLQGDCVPKILKVMLAPTSVCIAMTPPHPIFWHEASATMPEVLKARCVEAFQKIHDRGVLHGDVELRHMLISADGKVTIIDFQESRALHPNKEVLLERATPAELRYEMRKVKFKLDFQGARLYEHSKISRERHRRKRNSRTRRARRGEDIFSGPELPLPEDVENPPIDDAEFVEYWCLPSLMESHLKVITVPGLPKGLASKAKRQYVERVKEWQAEYERCQTALETKFVQRAGKSSGCSDEPSKRVKVRDFAFEPPPPIPLAYPVRPVSVAGEVARRKAQLATLLSQILPPKDAPTLLEHILQEAEGEESLDVHQPGTRKRGRDEDDAESEQVPRKKPRLDIHPSGLEESDSQRDGGVWLPSRLSGLSTTVGRPDKRDPEAGWLSFNVISSAVNWLGISTTTPDPVPHSRRSTVRSRMREPQRRGVRFWPF